MLINELVGYKQNPIYKNAKNDYKSMRRFDTTGVDKFKEYMRINGFNHLGAGAYAHVYEKPGYPWVFKIFKGDPAYFAYLNYALKHQDNPSVPKIKGKFIKLNEFTYVVRLEKLTKTNLNNPDMARLVKILRQYNTIRDMSIEHRTWLEGMYPDIFKIYKDLSAYVPPYVIDLHAANYMMRGDTIVIIDPLVGF